MAITFFITRRNELLANRELVDQFAGESEAANMAVRLAQDANKLYAILYERR